MEHLTRALEMGKDDATTRAALGFAQAALGETATAKRNLEKALERGPSETLEARIEEGLATIAEPGSTVTGTHVDEDDETQP